MDDATARMHGFLDACEDVENIVAEICPFFADHYRENEKVARLWRKTALEEENHARQARLAKKIMGNIAWISINAWRQAFSTRTELRGPAMLSIALTESGTPSKAGGLIC